MPSGAVPVGVVGLLMGKVEFAAVSGLASL